MIIHTVRRGDTIFSVARAYGVPPTRVISDNLLTDPNRLAVGQDLVILYPTATHTVVGGDTLASISARYGVTRLALYRNNPVLGGEPDIYPGQVLNIAYEAPPLGSLSTVGYAYPNIEPAALRRTLPYLTYLSVFSTGIRPDGTLIAPSGEEFLIGEAGEYGAEALLVLTSLTEGGTFSAELAARVLGDPNLSAAVTDAVVRAVTEKGYGGADVDFEYIPAEYADDYARFLEGLRDALPESMPLFVSLAPKVRRDQPGLLYEAHDYRALGAAADRALLMTYEWGYTYGPPLAVAPLGEVRRVVEYAVSEIEPEKLFLGMPNYGYDWALPYVRGESMARSLSNTAAVELALDRGAAISYDEAAEAPTFSYYDRPRTYADAVEHIVWFENARSVEAKLRLAREFGFYGVGVWNIMRYFPSLWTVLNALFSIRKRG